MSSPSKTSGFTLTELIVVISILAILGMIAFTAYGKFIQSAKNSTITSTTQTIAKALSITNAKNSVSYRNYITHDPKLTVAGYVGGGVTELNPGAVIDIGTNYSVGILTKNMYSILGLSSSDMRDDRGNDLIIGAVDSRGGAYQVVSTIAEFDVDIAVVQGNYSKGGPMDVDGLVHAQGAANVPAAPNTAFVPYSYLPNTASKANPWLMSIGSKIATTNNLNGTSARFYGPLGSTVDDLGNIYVSDTNNNLIKKYTATGVYIMTIGGGVDFNGNGTGALLTNPQGIATDIDNNVYVLHFSTTMNYTTINKYSSTGAYLMTIGGGASDTGNGTAAKIYAHDLTVDNLGFIYVADTIYHKMKKYSSTGAYLMTIGGGVSETGSLTNANIHDPSDVVVDNLKNIYIVDEIVNKVKKYSSTGAYLMTIGGGVSETGSLTNAFFGGPKKMTIDALNNVYILDAGSNKVKKYNAAGIYLTTLIEWSYGDNASGGTGAQLVEPSGISLDISGNIYITDSGGNKVKKYTSTGNYLMTLGSYYYNNTLNGTSAHLLYPGGVALDGSGNVYVTSYGQIKKYTPNGNFLMAIGGSVLGDNTLDGVNAQLGAVKGITLDVLGNIYVSNNNNIKKYSSTGTYLMTIGGGGSDTGSLTNASLAYPLGIALDLSGNIYVVDSWNDKIKKYSSTGTYLMTIGSTNGDIEANGTSAKLNRPEGVTVDSLGYIYITDTGNCKIKKYTPAGNYNMTIGCGSDPFGNGVNADLYSPSGITLDSLGNIYFTDKNPWYDDTMNANRIKKYTSTGVYLMTLGSGPTGDNTLGGLDAQFQTANGIAVDSSGNIYITDESGDHIKKYGP